MAHPASKVGKAPQRSQTAPRKNSRGRLAYWMILPAVLGLLVIFFVPMLWGVAISFKTYNKFTLSQPFFQLEWSGFQEYARALDSLGFGFTQSLSVTLSYTLLTVLLSAALGLGAALVANRKFFGALVFKGVVLLPYILPSVVSLITLRFMLTSDGVINALLTKVGLISEPVFLARWQQQFLEHPARQRVGALAALLSRLFGRAADGAPIFVRGRDG